MTEGIRHHICMPQFILEGEVKFGEKVLPPRLLGHKLLLGCKATRHHIVSEDYKVRSEEVMASCPHVVDHCGHLLLMHRVQSLGVTKLPPFKSHWVAHLH